MQLDDEYESQIIYNEQPLQKIDEISIKSLNNYSNRFRISYQQIQQQNNLNKSLSNNGQQFNQGIIKLIGKIQPSKIAIHNILSLILNTKQEYFPEDNQLNMRNQAKKKKILIINKLTTQEQFKLINDVKNQLEIFLKFILLRQSQLGSILFLEDNRNLMNKQQLIQKYKQSNQQILQYIIHPQHCHKPINFTIIIKIFQYQYQLFDNLSKKMEKLQKQLIKFKNSLTLGNIIKQEHSQIINKILKELKILKTKQATLVQLFSYACLKPQDDLFSQKLSSQRWRHLFQNDKILYKLYGQPQQIDKSFNQLRKNLNIVNAAMNIFSQAKVNPSGLKSWSAQLQSIKKVLKLTVDPKKAHHQAELMICQPSQQLAKQIWNLPQKKQFKIFIEHTLPSIQFSEHFHIPRKLRDYFFRKLNGQQIQLPNSNITNLKNYYDNLFEKGSHEQKLSIRINNWFSLELQQLQNIDQEKKSNFFQKNINKLKNNIQNIKKHFKSKHQPPKTLIFHIHGGGFISMSSFIHQTYTRKWANSLKVPIISVDYGKAPEYPYPEGLYDCLEAYIWTLSCMNQIYQVLPQKIILVGDSAGGNLVASLTNLLIQWKLRVPDGIVLAYPALNLHYYDFTPSLLTALNDMILPHTFLKICLKSYLKDPAHLPDKNYFISPIKTPSKILKKYPHVRIFVGSKDPFHDDCCRFTQYISNNTQKSIKLLVFEQFPHGFLQFDMKNSPHYYCQQATKQVQNALGQLINI